MSHYSEAKRVTDVVKEEMESEGLVVTDCPNCMTEIMLHPKVGGEDYSPRSGGSNISYKKGTRKCPECGKLVAPILSIRASDDHSEE